MQLVKFQITLLKKLVQWMYFFAQTTELLSQVFPECADANFPNPYKVMVGPVPGELLYSMHKHVISVLVT